MLRVPFIAALIGFVAWAGGAWAVPLTVPTGLNPGDQYRLIFESSTVRDATSTDIADYNAFVAALAAAVPELAALGTTWTAIASTATIDARDNTNTNPVSAAGVPIYATGGKTSPSLVFTDNADIWDGLNLTVRVFNENGLFNTNKTLGRAIWTGTGGDGTAASPLGTATPTIGGTAVSKTPNAFWIDTGTGVQTEPHFLYGISGILTVVPEPGTAALVLLGLTGYGISALRGRRDAR